MNKQINSGRSKKLQCNPKCRSRIWCVCIGIVYLVALISYTFGKSHFFLDLFSHFQLQYTLGGISLLLIGAVLRVDRLKRAIAGLIVIMHFFLIVYPIRVSNMDQTKAAEVDLFFMNSNHSNEDYLDIYDEYLKYRSTSNIYKEGSVAFVESNDGIIKLFSQEFGGPVEHEGAGGQSCAVFSKTFTAIPNDILPEFEYPTCIVTFENITQIVVHPYPPLNKDFSDRQALYFEQIADYMEQLRSEGKDFVIMGDLNSTKYSGVFRKYFGSNDRTDLYTWELGKPWMLQLDHVFSNLPIDVYGSKGLSSDHIGLFVNLHQD